jgi:hypothetical protein
MLDLGKIGTDIEEFVESRHYVGLHELLAKMQGWAIHGY